MTLRLLPLLLAVAATCDLAAADADYEAALRAFSRLRLAVLVDPESARRAFCASPPPAASACRMTLGRGPGERPCDAPWPPGPPRFHRVAVACRLPRWAASLRLPPLQARILR